MSKIVVNHTSILINNYNLGDQPKLEKYLSVWNDTRYKYDPKGFMYDEENKILHIPRGVDISYIERLFDLAAEINYTPDEYEKVSIKVKATPKNNDQRKAIAFLTSKGDFIYTAKYSQLLLNLPTGEGKTVISTMALATIGLKTIIITHIDRIRKQWCDTLLKMTDLGESDICVIEGSNIINKLMMSSKNRYKVYLVNHGTILAYAKTNGWDAISELFKHLKIGVKIFDEAHLNFENIIRIDLYTNTKKSIYITATFERSDYDENKLFAKCFKNIVRFSIKDTSKQRRKHTMFLGILYNSKPSIADQASIYTYKGFSKIAYANYQLQCDEFFKALVYAVNYFNNKEGKMLILSSKIELVDAITEFLRDNIKDKEINSYHSKISGNKDEILLNSDIISTTPKSAGVGLDIPKLRTVIMVESYSSKVQAEQASGRLREYSPDEYTFYIELVDIGFKKVYDMYKKRLLVFKNKCAKIISLDISK